MSPFPPIALPDPKERLLVAISGGRDSVALLHGLVMAGHRRLIVVHLNHGLRGRESGHDAAFVRRLARRYDLPCELERCDVEALAAEQRMSLETAGRQARQALFFKLAKKHRVKKVLLAHHADDQAETILANLCRGSSLSGLAGMQPETEIRFKRQILTLSRPLLAWRRADIDRYIATHRLSFREDSSNTSLEHRRNRLRHEVLPLLKDVFDRDVSPVIARLGLLAQRDDAALWKQALALKSVHLDSDHHLIRIRDLQSQEPAVLSRLLHHWLSEVLALPGIGFEVVESALAMLQPDGPAKINLAGDCHLRRKAGRLWVEH